MNSLIKNGSLIIFLPTVFILGYLIELVELKIIFCY